MQGEWPTVWRLHLLPPLYKAVSRCDPSNYRGILLTTILSKVAERVIWNPLMHFLRERCFGNAQWAFRHKAGARDLVTIKVARLLLHVCQWRNVGLYWADILGAFDKVCHELLMASLSAVGVAPAFLDFLHSYLLPRRGQVVVAGALSEALFSIYEHGTPRYSLGP